MFPKYFWTLLYYIVILLGCSNFFLPVFLVTHLYLSYLRLAICTLNLFLTSKLLIYTFPYTLCHFLVINTSSILDTLCVYLYSFLNSCYCSCSLLATISPVTIIQQAYGPAFCFSFDCSFLKKTEQTFF